MQLPVKVLMFLLSNSMYTSELCKEAIIKWQFYFIVLYYRHQLSKDVSLALDLDSWADSLCLVALVSAWSLTKKVSGSFPLRILSKL